MADDFPYKAEYAKSSRASCKTCKGNIQKETLRLAVMVQSPMFDGKVPHWYHTMCFFSKQRPQSVEEIGHFDSLRWEDQQKIKAKLGNSTNTTSNGSTKGNKKSKPTTDFTLEYAKSGRAACIQCEEKILKDVIRIGKMDFSSEKAKRFGGMYRWNHVDCFVKEREDLEFFNKIDSVSGFNTLSAEDKKSLRSKLPEIKGKRKAEPSDETDSISKKPKLEDDKTQKQNKIMYSFRDWLQKNLKKAEMADLLYHNEYTPPKGDSKILDILSDMMTFGALHSCTVCGNGDFVYVYGKGYMCNGKISEWTRCENTVDVPKRRPFEIPTEMKEAFSYLKKYKFKDYGSRQIIKISKREDNNNEMKSKKMEKLKPLNGMSFAIVGKSLKKAELKKIVTSFGGTVTSSVKNDTTAIVTTSDFFDSKSKNRKCAEEYGIQCVGEDFFEEIKDGGAVLMLEKKNMAPWSKSPLERMSSMVNNTKSKRKDESMYTKSVPDKMKVLLKGGAAVDPASELEKVSHVYQRGGKIYNCVLGMVDISRGSNSYYKLQIIEDDGKRSWNVFRSWGRIGTTIGGNKLDYMEDAGDAIRHFEGLYEEKTGNSFNTKHFTKVAGGWYPMEIDYGAEIEDIKVDVKKSKSKLPEAVKKFVSLIFDVSSMKEALVEYEIDLKKMPLGKISKKQIEKAYKVLSEAQELITSMDTKDVKTTSDTTTVSIRVQLLDCSNRFYTLIPHDFGMKTPPLLDNEEIVKGKILMLDNLSEIEVAYSLLKSEEEGDTKNVDTIDKYYRKLKTNIDVLKDNSDEFQMVQKYLKNTHASTHSHFDLKLKEVFKIEREGEKKRFKPFQKLQNHQLLWHGSRTTNFAGILSQGLRIAPPEAPTTGYMFGKGVYFADMVSKSANYCCTSGNKATGFLMLCEVALGKTYDRTNAEYVKKLPSGKHSTKGLGRTCPDPKDTVTIEEKIQVPLGKPVPSEVENTALLYNEYIVYDVAQINAKYLIEVKFNYKF